MQSKALLLLYKRILRCCPQLTPRHRLPDGLAKTRSLLRFHRSILRGYHTLRCATEEPYFRRFQQTDDVKLQDLNLSQARNQSNFFATIMDIYLIGSGVKRRVIETLSGLGICHSYCKANKVLHDVADTTRVGTATIQLRTKYLA